ncbi:hypothetical protein BV898_03724 [Hypsibius exemplaris]|uniref:Uncharacterized protein n=1 Tax=Hypsibius exemplaris TaxID=2072580 RepID=A0A1W0X4L2_HYPEX|nr:hypothetical protein BV898_03724 [Hypsibius exemplaris]
MTKNVKFRDNPDLDMGRYQIPRYTGHFPTENSYQQESKGQATKTALGNGGYFDHDIAHSMVENNREDPNLVLQKMQFKNETRNHFVYHEHMQGGCPKYRDGMMSGFTGHVPGMQDAIGQSYRRGALDGTLEFERVKAGIPRFRFPLTPSTKIQPIGGRQNCVTGNTDRDAVPIDDTTPLFVPRYMGHNHQAIMATFFPREHCFPGFGYCQRRKSAAFESPNKCEVFRDVVNLKAKSGAIGTGTSMNELDGLLEYNPKILPRPPHPHAVPVAVRLDQPKKMRIAVTMPSWQPSTERKLRFFYDNHAKSGFSGFVPNTRNVLGSSMNREIVEEHQVHLKQQD